MPERRRKFYGWGYEDQGPNDEQKKHMAERMAKRFGLAELTLTPVPREAELRLREPRVKPPDSLAEICSMTPHARAEHSYGRSFRDIVRAFRRDYPNPFDFVAYPRDEADVVRLLEWCDACDVAASPYGGGSSVVGGVEPPAHGDYRGAVSIDLGRLDRVVEIDRASRAARIQAGVFGPALEDQLRPHGLTLRHFPQSFEFSALGGWIATRSGGHYATLYTHIDDFVESVRAVTPRGIYESRRLPGSGAGPSPDRMLIGSEGILGVITEAWMRLQERPKFRAGASVAFPDFMTGARAVRAIAQAGLYPANCRLLDPGEAANAGANQGEAAVMVLAFESADHDLEAWMKRALECCADFGGRVPQEAARTRTDADATHEGAAGAWRDAFLKAPYLRDALVAMGMVSETFETAITWDRFENFHTRLMERAHQAVREVCGQGTVTVRFTHAYPDGPAPYYTILAPGKRGSELEQWDEIKRAVSDTLIDLGGTITHHHAVGRDHRQWYDRQRPELFAAALRAAKHALDPNAILNPGVLIDPESP
ncbi:MAG TPA: FAD-binding oxidoreductase [Candidatus Binataceae bacterium]|jgi:alkyldihydroxyacetonephosphate synthase|nr:FAD-binding oxidoreductase [Candidatus Binataceae bacterium]